MKKMRIFSIILAVIVLFQFGCMYKLKTDYDETIISIKKNNEEKIEVMKDDKESLIDYYNTRIYNIIEGEEFEVCIEHNNTTIDYVRKESGNRIRKIIVGRD